MSEWILIALLVVYWLGMMTERAIDDKERRDIERRKTWHD